VILALLAAGLSPLEACLLAVLASYQDESGVAWPSAATLAKRANVSKPTVHRALRSLAAAGWIERLPGGRAGKIRLHVRAKLGEIAQTDEPTVIKMTTVGTDRDQNDHTDRDQNDHGGSATVINMTTVRDDCDQNDHGEGATVIKMITDIPIPTYLPKEEEGRSKDPEQARADLAFASPIIRAYLDRHAPQHARHAGSIFRLAGTAVEAITGQMRPAKRWELEKVVGWAVAALNESIRIDDLPSLVELLADAAKRCPEQCWAGDVRGFKPNGERWGDDRSGKVSAVLAVGASGATRSNWAGRLEVARAWEAAGRPERSRPAFGGSFSHTTSSSGSRRGRASAFSQQLTEHTRQVMAGRAAPEVIDGH